MDATGATNRRQSRAAALPQARQPGPGGVAGRGDHRERRQRFRLRGRGADAEVFGRQGADAPARDVHPRVPAQLHGQSQLEPPDGPVRRLTAKYCGGRDIDAGVSGMDEASRDVFGRIIFLGAKLGSLHF